MLTEEEKNKICNAEAMKIIMSSKLGYPSFDKDAYRHPTKSGRFPADKFSNRLRSTHKIMEKGKTDYKTVKLGDKLAWQEILDKPKTMKEIIRRDKESLRKGPVSFEELLRGEEKAPKPIIGKLVLQSPNYPPTLTFNGGFPDKIITPYIHNYYYWKGETLTLVNCETINCDILDRFDFKNLVINYNKKVDMESYKNFVKQYRQGIFTIIRVIINGVEV